MSVDAALRTAREVFGLRFLVVGCVPTIAACAFLLLLAFAGAPGPLRFADAWQAIAGLNLGQLVLGALGLVVLAVLVQPLQLPMVRLLEGYWPRWAALPRRYGTWRQTGRRRRLARAAELPEAADHAAVQRAGQAGTVLRRLFPVGGAPLLPTALGNALAAAESRAGREYGLDGVVAWPRLYLVLDEMTRSVVDDRRNALDGMVRLSVTAVVAGVAAGALLAGSGWWLLLALAPLVIARIAYRGAVHEAVAYGEAVQTAFDLNRFELLRRLRLPMPADQDAEREANEVLCTLWRQAPGDRSLPLTYEHPEPK
ncbi:hypothetical protein GCM10010174_50550 [Kutzneria viridogrisea]|uniref:Uncharacterized protein n=1 Tax=Kutzneria viridogrisea TaxID=47990 RepID=A0ABR6B8T4_9PSEU|nr:hypothetical protein [Kutzneria viridogrisea]